jgi:hypothetical protein
MTDLMDSERADHRQRVLEGGGDLQLIHETLQESCGERERERETKRETETERERRGETDRERGGGDGERREKRGRERSSGGEGDRDLLHRKRDGSLFLLVHFVTHQLESTDGETLLEIFNKVPDSVSL